MILFFVIGYLGASPLMDWWYRLVHRRPSYEPLSDERLQSMRETATAIVMNHNYSLDLRERAFEQLDALDEYERELSRFDS